jgi:undecaprenol kinase
MLQPPRPFKNRPLRDRLGFALAGIRVVFLRERSFRTQTLVAVATGGATAVLQPGWLWGGLVALAIGLVLALEAVNAAAEYLIDHIHPGIAEEIGRAKDAAAGAALIGSAAAAAVGAMLLLSRL